MLSWLANAWRVPELRRRVLFTAAVLAVYRLGSWIPAPGVDLIAPGTKYEPRWNQLDVSVKRTFRFARGRDIQAQAAVFNVLNDSPVLQEIQSYGPSLGQPQVILQGRMLRLAVLLSF